MFTLNILLYAVYYYVNNELLLVMLGIIYIGLSLKAVISDLIIIRLPPLPPIPQLMDVESDDSVNFKSKIIISFWLSMWVGISEAIRLLSTSLIKINIYLYYIIYDSCKSTIKYWTEFNRGFSLAYNTIKTNIQHKNVNIAAMQHKNKSNHQCQLPKPQLKFDEWLAGLIDGNGCFQLSKKGFASLEIVMELRDKHCLYQIKQKYGGSIKLRAGYNHLRYRLHHKAGLLSLINAVNGLIRNPIRIIQLGKICLKYNIDLKDSEPLSYYSGWLSGFFDADGSIYMNEASGQLFITASQKNRFLLDDLVKLYGGQIYVMVKQNAFKWTCFRKDEIISLVNDYFKVNPCRSEKLVRLNIVEKFYELRKLHAHSARADTVLGKTWENYTKKWNSVIIKDK